MLSAFGPVNRGMLRWASDTGSFPAGGTGKRAVWMGEYSRSENKAVFRAGIRRAVRRMKQEEAVSWPVCHERLNPGRVTREQ